MQDSRYQIGQQSLDLSAEGLRRPRVTRRPAPAENSNNTRRRGKRSSLPDTDRSWMTLRHSRCPTCRDGQFASLAAHMGSNEPSRPPSRQPALPDGNDRAVPP